MITFLNIALLIVGALSTLSAFGGKTYKDGTEWVLRRLTVRGGISLFCLITALGIGICREIYSANQQQRKEAQVKSDALQAQNDANQKQADLKLQLAIGQGDLKTANARLDGLRLQLRSTEDQITGGDGYPIVSMLTQFPDAGNSFPLRVSPSGKTPIYDVSFAVSEGAYKKPSQEEIQAMIQQSIAEANGHGSAHAQYIGVLNPGYAVPMNYVIHPALAGISTYRIGFNARNGGVQETLEVRFNEGLKIWQVRLEVKGERAKDPNKILLKQDWIPKKAFPLLVGEGQPR